MRKKFPRPGKPILFEQINCAGLVRFPSFIAVLCNTTVIVVIQCNIIIVVIITSCHTTVIVVVQCNTIIVVIITVVVIQL